MYVTTYIRKFIYGYFVVSLVRTIAGVSRLLTFVWNFGLNVAHKFGFIYTKARSWPNTQRIRNERVGQQERQEQRRAQSERRGGEYDPELDRMQRHAQCLKKWMSWAGTFGYAQNVARFSV